MAPKPEMFTIKLAEDSELGQKGQVVQLALQPSDVHAAEEIPTYLAGYMPPGYRADEASPVILVDKDTDKFRSFSSDDAFRRVDVKGANDSNVPEVDPSSSLATYTVVNRFIGSFVPTQTESNAGPNYQPRMAAARRCRRAVQLDREIDVFSTLIGTTTSYAAANRIALGGTENWNGGSASDPILAIHTGIEASAQQVTGIWMNQKVANALLRHDRVRDHMRQMLGDAAVQSALTAVADAYKVNVDFVIPGLPPVHVVAGKVKNESTGALDYIMPNVVSGVTAPPGVPQDGEEIATTYTFRRRGPSGVGFESREFRIENRGPLGGTMIVVSMADIAVMTGNNCGFVISNVIA